MLDKLKQFKLLIVLSLFLLAIPLYFTYNHFQQSSVLKEAFEKNERIEVLHHLMASGKYASDIRKAGYVVPPMVLFDWMEELTHRDKGDIDWISQIRDRMGLLLILE